MKVFIVDISGKVINYDIALCEAINNCFAGTENNEVVFHCPLYDEAPQCKTIRLLNLVPKRYKNGEYLWKRIIKFFELVINYIYVIIRVAWNKPDIIHFQWFPLMEVCSGEYIAVKIMKLFSKQTRMVLTIHNVYPHNFTNKRKIIYKKRFSNVDRLMNSYVVHTEETKEVVLREFNILEDRVFVIHHGVFIPKNFIPSANIIKGNKLTFIMYGNLSDYKGVDIFVEAIKELPESYRGKVKGVIAGAMQNKELCQKLQDISKDLNIEWHTYFLPEQELYERINDANVIVLPYKRISQSGVLLLALSFRRYVVTSNLAPFKETLNGFSDDMFFESENPKSLARLMMNYVDGRIDTERQMVIIEQLNNNYSWEKAAKKTIQLYYKVVEA